MNILLEKLKQLSKNQQLILGLSGIAILVITTCLLYWTTAPNYRLLFGDLTPKEASRLTAKLEAEHVRYQLKGNNTRLYVEEHKVDAMRLQLMTSPFKQKNQKGFELFDKSDFGLTDFSQKINYQRALQGELERTITSLKAVNGVRVHLVIPESHLFDEKPTPPSAAVTLDLNHALTALQIKSIQHLISASVNHLSPKHVVIVNSHSRLLTQDKNMSIDSHFNAKKSLEHYLTQKTLTLLSPIYKEDTVFVNIDVRLNYDNLTRENLTPETKGHLTHKKTSTHIQTDSTKKPAKNEDNVEETTYEIGHKKESYHTEPGKIERLTVSVVVPRSTSTYQLTQIKHLVETAIGFDAKRGDEITVEALITPSIKKASTPTPIEIKHPGALTFRLWVIVLFLLLATGTVTYRLRQTQQKHLVLKELEQWLITEGKNDHNI